MVRNLGCGDPYEGRVGKRCILRLGRSPRADDVHDPFNVFMKTGVTADGNLTFEASDAATGDYLEMEARMNCLVAISTCPGISSGPVHHRVIFEIYEPDWSEGNRMAR